MNKVYRKNNLYFRFDDKVGLLIYNTNNGLTYAYSYLMIDESIRQSIVDDNNAEQLLKKLLNNLSLDQNRLLPTQEYWPGAPQEQLEFPLTINWLISNSCTHKCPYCYADDVVNNISIVLNNDIEKTASNILLNNPLNVVLSGGEPLLNNNIDEIIKLLVNKTGITIDTNGHCFEKMKDLLPLIVENNIHVRVSLDTIRIKEMFKTRPLHEKTISNIESMNRTMNTIEILIENNVNFTIQTVLTKSNANDLESMGDKLCKMGVKVWRIFELQISDSNRDKCKSIMFDTDSDNIERKNKFFMRKFMTKNNWENMMTITTPANGDKNNVILVLPDGAFYTQAKHNIGKVLIDSEHPYLPTKDALSYLSWGAHFDRYIG